MYGDRISHVIDRDESGFIRISEVNAFTDRMPAGWSLPEWCAYAAVGTSVLTLQHGCVCNMHLLFLGWTYEARIYRKRITNILRRMFEMHAKGVHIYSYRGNNFGVDFLSLC